MTRRAPAHCRMKNWQAWPTSWARFSETAAQRYRNSPHHLMAADWASGDQVWLIDVFTPFGGAQDVLKDLRENVLAGQIVRQLMPAPNSVGKVLAWPALQPKPAPDMEPGISTSRNQA